MRQDTTSGTSSRVVASPVVALMLLGKDAVGSSCLPYGICRPRSKLWGMSQKRAQPKKRRRVTAITSQLPPSPYPADEWTERSCSVRRVGGLHVYTAFGMIMGAMIGCAIMAIYGLGMSMGLTGAL